MNNKPNAVAWLQSESRKSIQHLFKYHTN